MVGPTSNGRFRPAFSVTNGGSDHPPGSNGSSDCGGIEFTREDVEALLNEKIKVKNKFSFKICGRKVMMVGPTSNGRIWQAFSVTNGGSVHPPGSNGGSDFGGIEFTSDVEALLKEIKVKNKFSFKMPRGRLQQPGYRGKKAKAPPKKPTPPQKGTGNYRCTKCPQFQDNSLEELNHHFNKMRKQKIH